MCGDFDRNPGCCFDAQSAFVRRKNFSAKNIFIVASNFSPPWNSYNMTLSKKSSKDAKRMGNVDPRKKKGPLYLGGQVVCKVLCRWSQHLHTPATCMVTIKYHCKDDTTQLSSHASYVMNVETHSTIVSNITTEVILHPQTSQNKRWSIYEDMQN